MNSTPGKAVEPRTSYTFDAIPEDDETQDELNRRLRKPGEPGYCPPAKTGEASSTQPGNAQGEPSVQPRKG
jgi:hypothetical protein